MSSTRRQMSKPKSSTTIKAGKSATTLHVAVLILVLALIGNINSHYCFDGTEPPVTVHFELLDGHPEHKNTEQLHSDVDRNELSSALLSKLPDHDQSLFLSALLFLFSRIIPLRQTHIRPDDGLPVWEAPSSLRPPLRAPPKNSR